MRANRDKDCSIDDNKANLRCSFIDSMIRGVINYYNDFIAPYKSCRDIQPDERPLFNALLVFLRDARDLSANEIQNGIYQIAKNFNYDPKSWFTSLYEVILGASNGPRFGHFIGLYGLDKMISLIESKLST